MSKRFLDPNQRQIVLKALKKGPQFNDRALLGDFAGNLAERVTGKNLQQHCDQHMKEWRHREAHGPIPAQHTFLY